MRRVAEKHAVPLLSALRVVRGVSVVSYRVGAEGLELEELGVPHLGVRC